MSPLRLRRAEPSESTALSGLASEAYQMYVRRMGGQRPAPMDADYAAAITQECVWVAEVDDQIVGFVACVAESGWTWLDNLAVDAAWRGRGIGRMLISEVERHAKGVGTFGVRLYTNAVMVENQRLYLHLGYVETRRSVEGGFDRVFYEKRFPR